MSRTLKSAAALVAALLCSAPAQAGSAADRATALSAFALPIEVAPTVMPIVAVGDASYLGTSVPAPRLESIQYRP